MARKLRRKSSKSSPKEKYFSDNDYSDTSPSQSQYESERDEEDVARSVSNYDDDASYMASNSINYTPSDQFSSHALQSLPKVVNATQTLESASNAPNLSWSPTTQIAPYYNIATFPVFHGGPNECPIMHLSRFTKVCRANNVSSIDMTMRIFPVTLESEAALWYDLNIEPYPSLNWEEIKSLFLQAYNRIELIDQLRSELMMINQGDEEPVRSYFLRLQFILKKWPGNGLSDSLIKGIFVDGLREDFQDWIIPQKPDSLNDALKLAFGFEQVRSVRAGRKGGVKCGFCEGAHEEGSCVVRERMRDLWLRNKDKQKQVVGVIDSSRAGKNEADEEGKKEEEGEQLVVVKKSQCQCSKHQCWKKFERNESFVSTSSNAN